MHGASLPLPLQDLQMVAFAKKSKTKAMRLLIRFDKGTLVLNIVKVKILVLSRRHITTAAKQNKSLLFQVLKISKRNHAKAIPKTYIPLTVHSDMDILMLILPY